MSVEISEDGTQIKWDRWFNNGGMLSINRDCLDLDDPNQTWNYLRANGVKNPELYGIKNPYDEMFQGMSREDLMDEVIHLRKEIDSMMRWL